MTIGTGKMPARGAALGRRLGRLLEATGAETVQWLHVLLSFSAFCATAATAALRRDSWRRPVRHALYMAIDRVAVGAEFRPLQQPRSARNRPVAFLVGYGGLFDRVA